MAVNTLSSKNRNGFVQGRTIEVIQEQSQEEKKQTKIVQLNTKKREKENETLLGLDSQRTLSILAKNQLEKGRLSR